MSALLFACTVAWVIDGDTLTCSDHRKVRLAGIDAPELHGCVPGRHCTPGNAKQSLHSLIRLSKGRTLRCEAVGTSYDRTVAFCSAGSVDLSCAQVRSGYAVVRYQNRDRVCR
jgi:endonuclease YncB( thermonuclease family)